MWRENFHAIGKTGTRSAQIRITRQGTVFASDRLAATDANRRIHLFAILTRAYGEYN